MFAPNNTTDINPKPKPQPILKWPGGKEKELQHILPVIPASYARFFEPFVGGGSVFLNIDCNTNFINDLSRDLITVYKYIAGYDRDFFSLLQRIDISWHAIDEFFNQDDYLKTVYHKYQSSVHDKGTIVNDINTYISCNRPKLLEIVNSVFNNTRFDIFIDELRKNLVRKICRMLVLEEQKHKLPPSDLHDNLLTALKSALYMYYRSLYNLGIGDGTHIRTVLFLFLRNYAYSGMFRYNDKGEFNVPYGGIAYNSKRLTKKMEYYQSSWLRNKLSTSCIESLDFEEFLCKHNPAHDDFIFLDPPYDSEFSTYARNEFTKHDQNRLADYLINKCHAKWMLVIKNTDFIYNLYNNKPGINISSFDKKYTVSFMNRNNRSTTHLLITNYNPQMLS